jgi:hypothetical protein
MDWLPPHAPEKATKRPKAVISVGLRPAMSDSFAHIIGNPDWRLAFGYECVSRWAKSIPQYVSI